MICLNVGCHDIHIKDFVNIDIDENMKPDLILDATKLRSHFEDDSIDFIYCGHFLEHLNLQDANQVVGDFHKLLRVYGSLVCVVPDYTKAKNMKIEDMESVILADGQHKILFDEVRLKNLFSQNNFTALNVNVKDLSWCRFPEVEWQSAIIAIKHPVVVFPNG